MAIRKTTTENQAENAVAPATGATAGLATGAAVGAAVGGPVGAAVGAAIGGPIGALVGDAVNYSDAEPHFKQHWENGPYKSITKWEEVSPAYKYGYESASSETYQGKPYSEVSTHLKKGWTGKTKFEDVEPMIRTAWESRAVGSSHAETHVTAPVSTAKTKKTARAVEAEDAVIPVVEEELQVGKRKVEKGGVRVQTHVTETPVEEQVSLHEEHVKVERRPVNRAVTAADETFKEGTIELHETAEEAVVAKRARVVEEIHISKHASDRTHTVRDSVRKTDVEVEKTGGKAQVGPIEWEKAVTAFEKDFKTRHHTKGYTFEQYTPAYRFGYNLASDPRFHGEWTEVEPEARKYWEEKNKGTWAEFKDAIHHSWETIKGNR